MYESQLLNDKKYTPNTTKLKPENVRKNNFIQITSETNISDHDKDTDEVLKHLPTTVRGVMYTTHLLGNKFSDHNKKKM